MKIRPRRAARLGKRRGKLNTIVKRVNRALKKERGQPCPRGDRSKLLETRGQGCPRAFGEILERTLTVSQRPEALNAVPERMSLLTSAATR